MIVFNWKNSLFIQQILIVLSLFSLNFYDTRKLAIYAMDIEQENISPSLRKREKGWSIWQRWIDFPFDRFEVGISNMDLGAMLDLEYFCFGFVGDENNQIKQEVYWYRISEIKEKIGDNNYVQIEVGCWLDNSLKSSVVIYGIEIL